MALNDAATLIIRDRIRYRSMSFTVEVPARTAGRHGARNAGDVPILYVALARAGDVVSRMSRALFLTKRSYSNAESAPAMVRARRHWRVSSMSAR